MHNGLLTDKISQKYTTQGKLTQWHGGYWVARWLCW